jgi:hypothetical protein
VIAIVVLIPDVLFRSRVMFVPTAFSTTVVDSVSASVKRKTTSAATASGRPRDFVIIDRRPDFGRIEPALVDVVTMELPSIEDVISGKHQ